VLTVVEPSKIGSQNDLICKLFAEQDEARRRKRGEQILSSVRTMLIQSLTNSRVHTELREGAAASEILDAATAWMADKIVVGAHGASPNRLLPGSLSRSIARHAGCSVEIVRLKSAPPGCMDDKAPTDFVTTASSS
jgi:nucleotide-binding universal stress UspA family protein